MRFYQWVGWVALGMCACASGSISNTGTGIEAPTEGALNLEGTSVARTFFDDNVRSILELKCATCHQGPVSQGPAFLGDAPEEYHDSMVGVPLLIGDTVEASFLLQRGEHMGAGESSYFDEEETEVLSEWISLRSES